MPKKKKEPWYIKYSYLTAGLLTLVIYLLLYLTSFILERGGQVPMDEIFYIKAIHFLPLIAAVLLLAGIIQYTRTRGGP